MKIQVIHQNGLPHLALEGQKVPALKLYFPSGGFAKIAIDASQTRHPGAVVVMSRGIWENEYNKMERLKERLMTAVVLAQDAEFNVDFAEEVLVSRCW